MFNPNLAFDEDAMADYLVSKIATSIQEVLDDCNKPDWFTLEDYKTKVCESGETIYECILDLETDLGIPHRMDEPFSSDEELNAYVQKICDDWNSWQQKRDKEFCAKMANAEGANLND